MLCFLETQVVDLTCTADDEVYDLTGISESPTIVPAHSPIVVGTFTYLHPGWVYVNKPWHSKNRNKDTFLFLFFSSAANLHEK